MLARNPSLLNKAVDEWPPVSLAALRGKAEVVRYLLEKGASANAKDPWYAPLSKAVYADNTTIIDLLLAKGADPKRGTPLLYATDNAKLFRYMVSKGADIHAPGRVKETLLSDTVDDLNLENTRFLLERGLDVNEGEGGYPPLTRLCFSVSKPEDKVLAVARLLLDKGADPNITDKSADPASKTNHRNSLSSAVLQRYPAMVRLLLTYESPHRCTEATINAARKDLHFTASKGDKLTKKDVTALREIAQLLNEPLPDLPDLPVPQEAQTNLADPIPTDPLSAAAYRGDLKSLQRLVKAGKSLKTKDSEGRTPLHYAALGGWLDAARWLLANGAEINARDAKDATPLALAHRDTQDAPTADRRAAIIAFLASKGAAE